MVCFACSSGRPAARARPPVRPLFLGIQGRMNCRRWLCCQCCLISGGGGSGGGGGGGDVGKISRPNKRCGCGAEAARVAARGDRRRRRVTPVARRSRTGAGVAGAAADGASLLLLKCVVSGAAQNEPSTHEGLVGKVKTCHIYITLAHTARAGQPMASAGLQDQ